MSQATDPHPVCRACRTPLVARGHGAKSFFACPNENCVVVAAHFPGTPHAARFATPGAAAPPESAASRLRRIFGR